MSMAIRLKAFMFCVSRLFQKLSVLPAFPCMRFVMFIVFNVLLALRTVQGSASRLEVRVAVVRVARIHWECESIYVKILLNIGGSDYLLKEF